MTYDEIKAAWNVQADEHNQWDSLSEDEKVEWAARLAAAKTAQLATVTAAPSDETLRLAGIIADKIEDGTLFQAGIFSRRDLADKVRAVVRAARLAAQTADDAQDAARYRLLRRKVCIVGGKFHILNLDPRYIAPDAAVELDAAIDAAIAAQAVCGGAAS